MWSAEFFCLFSIEWLGNNLIRISYLLKFILSNEANSVEKRAGIGCIPFMSMLRSSSSFGLLLFWLKYLFVDVYQINLQNQGCDRF